MYVKCEAKPWQGHLPEDARCPLCGRAWTAIAACSCRGCGGREAHEFMHTNAQVRKRARAARTGSTHGQHARAAGRLRSAGRARTQRRHVGGTAQYRRSTWANEGSHHRSRSGASPDSQSGSDGREHS